MHEECTFAKIKNILRGKQIISSVSPNSLHFGTSYSRLQFKGKGAAVQLVVQSFCMHFNFENKSNIFLPSVMKEIVAHKGKEDKY